MFEINKACMSTELADWCQDTSTCIQRFWVTLWLYFSVSRRTIVKL